MFNKTIIISLVFLFSFLNLKAQSEFNFGIVGKLEINKFNSIQSNDMMLTKTYHTNPQLAYGLYISKSLNKRFFLDGSVLLSRAKYDLNYISNTSTFINADIRLTEVNLNINYTINPNNENTKWFLFAGIQNLYRRWGEENYINSVLSNSYWPSNRIQYQTGFGTRFYLNNSKLFFQPFAGIRLNPKKEIIYDTENNQIFIGLVIGFKRIKNNKNRYNKCPTEF